MTHLNKRGFPDVTTIGKAHLIGAVSANQTDA
jgi:hypothetical protein